MKSRYLWIWILQLVLLAYMVSAATKNKCYFPHIYPLKPSHKNFTIEFYEKRYQEDPNWGTDTPPTLKKLYDEPAEIGVVYNLTINYPPWDEFNYYFYLISESSLRMAFHHLHKGPQSLNDDCTVSVFNNIVSGEQTGWINNYQLRNKDDYFNSTGVQWVQLQTYVFVNGTDPTNKGTKMASGNRLIMFVIMLSFFVLFLQ